MGRLSPADFHIVYGFRRAGGEAFEERSRQICSLDYPFTLPRRSPELRCCP
jgi:hypothetical protein